MKFITIVRYKKLVISMQDFEDLSLVERHAFGLIERTGSEAPLDAWLAVDLLEYLGDNFYRDLRVDSCSIY